MAITPLEPLCQIAGTVRAEEKVCLIQRRLIEKLAHWPTLNNSSLMDSDRSLEPPKQNVAEASRAAAHKRKQQWKELPGNRCTPKELLLKRKVMYLD